MIKHVIARNKVTKQSMISLALSAAFALSAHAQDELSLLIVINTASLQLIPGTIAAVRASAGAAAPFDILPAVWFSSTCSVCAGLCAAALFRRIWPCCR